MWRLVFLQPPFLFVFCGSFFKEKVGTWRISAVIIGFSGALIIIQFGSTEFRPILIMPVLAGACYAAGVVITPRLLRGPIQLYFDRDPQCVLCSLNRFSGKSDTNFPEQV